MVELADIEPGAIDHMIARGLVPQMPTDAAAVAPGPVSEPEGCKKAYQRAGLEWNSARAARGW